MEYVMVPVPEECLEAVQRYLQWGLRGGVTETWDPEVVQAIWDEVDADVRSLLVVAAESNRAHEPLTLADAAERLGMSHRSVVGTVVEVNALLRRYEGPMFILLLKPATLEHADGRPFEHGQFLTIADDVAREIGRLASGVSRV